MGLDKWKQFSAGSFGHFYIPYNDGQQRHELGYVLCHEQYNPRVLLLPEGRVTVVRDRKFQIVKPTSAHYKMISALVKTKLTLKNYTKSYKKNFLKS